MGKADYYKHGDYNAICDVCGFKYMASQLRKRWDNLMVCEGDFEPRQPQDFVRGVADNMSVPWSRPENADIFIGFCNPAGMSAWPGTATPGCAKPDFVSTAYDPSVDYSTI